MANKQVRESELTATNAVSQGELPLQTTPQTTSIAAGQDRVIHRAALTAQLKGTPTDAIARKKKKQTLDDSHDADVVHSSATEHVVDSTAMPQMPSGADTGSWTALSSSVQPVASEWVVAQLELPSLPASTSGATAVSAGAAPVATGSMLGSLSSVFGGAAAAGLAAGGLGGKSSAGTTSTLITVATPSTVAPVPTVAASDVISVFSDKYTNVPVSDWNPDWGQKSTLSDAKAIGGDHLKRVLNLVDFQGVQIASLDATTRVPTSGVLDVSSKTSLHIDYWLEKSGNFTLQLISQDVSAVAQKAGVVLNGQAGWNSVDIGLDEFSGVDATKIVQMAFISGSVTELHFDNVYFSSTASNYSTGIAGRLVNGYIKNAVVFQDNNGDGILNNDKDGVDEAGEEPYALTGADGKFNLVGASAKGGSLITVSSSDTIDTSTNEVVTNVFKAPANASVISPLSTLVEAGTKSGLTEEQVKTAFGITAADSLLSFDPVQKALSGNAQDIATALVFKTASVMVSNLMDVGNSLIQGANGSDNADFSASVVNSLVTTIKANSAPLDLSSASTVTSVLRQAITSSAISDTAALDTVLEKTASKLVDSNTLLKAQASASDPVAALEAIAKIEKSVQSTVAASVKEAVKDPAKTAALDALNVSAEVDKAVVPKVDQFQTLGFEASESIGIQGNQGATTEVVVQSDGNAVLKFVKGAGATAQYAGMVLSTGTSGSLKTIKPLDFSADSKKLGMWVHSAQSGTKVRIEIGDSAAGGYPKDNNWVAVETQTTKAGWEYLTFDFAAPSSRWIANNGQGYQGTTNLKAGVSYDMLNVFFDLGATPQDPQTYYIDGLGYAKASPGTAPLNIDSQSTPPTTDQFQTLGFEASESIGIQGNQGATTEVVVQSDGNAVLKFVKGAGATAQYAGMVLSTGTSGSLKTIKPLDFSADSKKLGMWVHSAQSGTKVRIEIGDSAAGGYPKDNNWVAVETQTTKAGWEYLTFDFAAPSSRWIANNGQGYQGTTNLKAGVSYDMLNVFFDLGATPQDPQTYYIDGLGYAKASPGTAPLNIDSQSTPPTTDQFQTLGFEASESIGIQGNQGATTEVVVQSDGNAVLKFVKGAGATAQYAGMVLSTGTSGSLKTIKPLDFSADSKKLGMWVHSAQSGTKVRIEIGDSAAGGYPKDNNWVAVETQTTKAGWEYLTFDFAAPSSRWIANNGQGYQGTTNLKAGVSYDMLNVFFDLGATPQDPQTYYIDGLGYAKASPGTAPLNIDSQSTPPTTDQFQTLGFEASESIGIQGNQGATTEVVVQSDGNAVLKFVKGAGATAQYAGMVLSTGTSGSLKTIKPLDFSADSKKLGMWVHSAQSGTKVRIEIGDSAAGGYPKDNNWVAVETQTTKAGWEYLTFDFAAPSSRWIANNGQGYQGTTNLKAGVSYDILNVFFDLGATKLTDQVYYFDELGYAQSSPGTSPKDIDYSTAPAIPEGYSLAFAEEFGGNIGESSSAVKVAPDASRWKLEIGAGGWGNNEAQTYTDSLDNAFVQNGALHIVANKTGDTITSARLKSIPTWEPYGYMEVRAKLPDSQGAWPAIWLLGKGTWPDTGEIDVMEWTKQYFNSSEVQAALHFRGTDNPKDDKSAWTYGDTQVKKSTTLSSPITDFHTYQVWWTQDYIRFGVDGNNDNAYFEYRKPANATSDNWPFSNPMDIILNMAIGGTYGGTFPSSNFKYEMLVDYVRVYQAGNEPELSDLLLFSSAVAAEDYETQFAGVDTFGNGASFNFVDADDPSDVYARVGAVVSGEGYATDVNVAFAAFTALGAGFADGYEAFSIKVRNTPNGHLEVKLIGGGVADSVANIELASYAGSRDLGNGWYDVTIPFADFTNPGNMGEHSGYLIGMPGDNGAEQFTFYFTDIELLVDTPVPPPELSDLLLFSSAVAAEDYETQFAGVDTFGNGASFNFVDADDPSDAYARVGAVVSGEGYATDVNVAFAAFTALGAGFADGYEAFSIKVRNTPNGHLEVKLIGGGVADSVANIELASYAGSRDLGNGWYDVTIPFADFTNPGNMGEHSGYLIGMPGDNGAEQFTFYFTDIELLVDTPVPPPELSDLLLFSSAVAAEDYETQFAGVDTFGNGASFNFVDADDPSDVYARVGAVVSGEGYATDVNVAFAAFTALGAGFADGYEAFSIKVRNTPNGHLEVKLIGGGVADSVANIELASYAGSRDLGNGWYDVTIPFADFTNPGNMGEHSGYLIGMPGDNGAEQFTFYFTDIELLVDTPVPPPELSDLLLFSSAVAAEDYETQFAGVDTFGNGASFNFVDADDPSDAYARVGAVVSGEGYATDVNVAFAAFTALGAGFADGYEAFSIKVRNTPNGHLEVKLIGGGVADSVANIELASYAGSRDLGNGWYDVTIPFADFTNPGNMGEHSGYLIGMPGDNGAEQFTFYFTDIELLVDTPVPPPELSDLLLFSSAVAAEDYETQFAGVDTFGNGASFNFVDADDPSDVYARVGAVVSGEGYATDVNVAFAAFTALGAGFADGYEAFSIKVRNTPNGHLEVKLIGGGVADSVANIELASYAGSRDLGNGWYDVTIPFADFTNPGNMGEHSGYLIGMPGDNGAEQFTFYFTDIELLVDTPVPPPELSDLLLFSSAVAAEDYETQFAGVDTFGNGASFNFVDADDPSDAYARVGAVVSGEGYATDVNVAFAAFTALGAGFADGYEAFSIKVRNTPNGHLEVKLIGGGVADSVANIELASYAGSRDLGNGWYDVTIPFADFTNPGNMGEHSGYLIGMPGDNGAEQFTFYFTDIELLVDTPVPPPELSDLLLFSSAVAAEDYETQFAGVDTFGNGASFNFVDADDPSDAYARVGAVVSGEGYATDVNVAFAAFTALGAGFADGYEAFSIKVRNTPNGHLEVKLIGGGVADSVANIELASYAGSRDLGNGWYDVTIPFADFTNPGNMGEHSGYLIGMPGDNGAEQFTFYFTDIELLSLDPMMGLTSGPADPTESAVDVVALFSDVFSPVGDVTWSTNWDEVTGPESVSLAGGNLSLKYSNVSYIGIEPNQTLNLSNMDTFHIDIWRSDPTAYFKIKLIDFGANGVWEQSGDNVEHELILHTVNNNPIAANQWVSLDIALSQFSGLTTKEHIGQLIVSSHKDDGNGGLVGSGEKLLIDNVYFYHSVI